MANLFDFLFGAGSQPVRRNLNLRFTVDDDGHPIIQTGDGESVSLSREGSIDRVTVASDNFYHCGCDSRQPAGGRCGEPSCGRISCQRCFTRCSRCHKPLCLEHVRTFAAEVHISVCGTCNRILKRQQIVRSIIFGALSPFVHFDDRKKP